MEMSLKPVCCRVFTSCLPGVTLCSTSRILGPPPLALSITQAHNCPSLVGGGGGRWKQKPVHRGGPPTPSACNSFVDFRLCQFIQPGSPSEIPLCSVLSVSHHGLSAGRCREEDLTETPGSAKNVVMVMVMVERDEQCLGLACGSPGVSGALLRNQTACAEGLRGLKELLVGWMPQLWAAQADDNILFSFPPVLRGAQCQRNVQAWVIGWFFFFENKHFNSQWLKDFYHYYNVGQGVGSNHCWVFVFADPEPQRISFGLFCYFVGALKNIYIQLLFFFCPFFSLAPPMTDVWHTPKSVEPMESGSIFPKDYSMLSQVDWDQFWFGTSGNRAWLPNGLGPGFFPLLSRLFLLHSPLCNFTISPHLVSHGVWKCFLPCQQLSFPPAPCPSVLLCVRGSNYPICGCGSFFFCSSTDTEQEFTSFFAETS